MPTRAGWLVLAGAGLAAVSGRLFGIVELFVLAAAMVAMAVVAVLLVRFRPVKVRVARRVTPRRVHAGETARVELHVANRTRLPMPVLAMRDPVSTTQGARLQLAPLAPGANAKAVYRLPTSRRGRISVGPLRLIRTDVLGLATRSVDAAGVTSVTVLPAWHLVAVPGSGADRGPLGQHLRMRALGRTGDEFRGLRNYVPGDDLRRIHWKASARSEDLKVREHEVAGLRNLTVVLDLDPDAYTPDGFERAVTAVTSIVVSAAEHGRDVRFLTTGGFDHTPGTTGTDPLLEHLAIVTPVPHATADRTLAQLGTRLSGGLLVLAGGRLGPGLLALLRGTAAADAVVAVACDAPVPVHARGVFLVDNSTDGAFVGAWNLLVGAAGDGGGGVERRSAKPVGQIVLGEASV